MLFRSSDQKSIFSILLVQKIKLNPWMKLVKVNIQVEELYFSRENQSNIGENLSFEIRIKFCIRYEFVGKLFLNWRNRFYLFSFRRCHPPGIFVAQDYLPYKTTSNYTLMIKYWSKLKQLTERQNLIKAVGHLMRI